MRLWLIILLLLLAIGGIVWRLLNLMWLDPDFLQRQGDARAIRTIEVPAYRGIIYDRRGDPLAVTTPVFSVWLNPQEFIATEENVTLLSEEVGVSAQQLLERLPKYASREFMYVKRGLVPDEAEIIRSLNIPGIYLQREFRRFYPAGAIAAHVVGFTNVDEKGQEGMELAYDQWLAGKPGRKRVLRDRLGNTIEELKLLSPASPGHDLHLSIDKRVQYIVYRELKVAAEEMEAKSASMVIIDVKTGEILAMANYPSYNPNSRTREPNEFYRNRIVTDVVEPGSVIKGITISNALASGQYKLDTPIDTTPGTMKIGVNEVKDVRNYGKLDVRGVLHKSSNVGITKIMLSLPEDSLWHLLNSVGFGQLTDLQFPGERAGQLIRPHRWHPFVLATWSFGYGFSVTPLQLAQAYAILANDGKKQPLTLIKQNPKELPAAEEVLESKVSKQVLEILEGVVMDSGGTGSRARVPGYRVAGKTGTVRVVGEKGYAKDRHIGNFIGVVPVSNPRFVAVVVVREPQNQEYYTKWKAPYGGLTAAPIFSKVMSEVLRLYNISPDNYEAE